jgi:Glycosyl hydrolase family 63 C-terminal domain
MAENEERARLRSAREGKAAWKHWGPYLSERQWGTVREDYSDSGDAWNYFSHDQARSRAYRWGEDGLAGLCDEQQQLCVALALWNGVDPILKERLFGLTNSEGNHGEDVKEYYFYLDSTPTHSYMKYLYKYPQRAYPYDTIVKTNRERGRNELEYELLDTGIFDEDRYFDVYVEYAKADPEDILMQITVFNRGPEMAELHVLPTFWFRNSWSHLLNWRSEQLPTLSQVNGSSGPRAIAARHRKLGHRYIYCEDACELLFTNNETNHRRISDAPSPHQFVKDGINDYIVEGRKECVDPARRGTKAAVHHYLRIPSGESRVVRVRLTDVAPHEFTIRGSTLATPFDKGFAEIMQTRMREADEFYAAIIPSELDADSKSVMRQALAGMLWSKQFYFYDVEKWLRDRAKRGHAFPRNSQWRHLCNADIISMPDKWEYPWYAAWDLAFHILPLALVDEDFGKQQLDLMLRGNYLHPSGQLPAYEWNFGDVNPPVHAWSTIFAYRLETARKGRGDIDWLERSFHPLLLNFTWWVNRKDRSGKNVFEGGFLGLDNIGVFDRSSALPTGGHLEQADGTAWMALFCQNMLEIAIELTLHRPTYARMCQKFVEHFLWIASSMIDDSPSSMWDEHDGFFYDVLQLPDGQAQRLKVRSMVGLLPLCAVTVFDGELRRRYPEVAQRAIDFISDRPELIEHIHDPTAPGCNDRLMTSILNEKRLRRVLKRMLDTNEFLSPYGIRSLSKYHEQHPFRFPVGSQEYRVSYLPAESDNGMFGGNSNWRGPIWMPVNVLIIRALLQYYTYYGDAFKVECPTGSGHFMNLFEVAHELTRRLTSIFLADEKGHRPVYGGTTKFQSDPHWSAHLQFFEYFHGDNGAGLGANHQTGWTGSIAGLMHLFAGLRAEQVLESGKKVVTRREEPVAASPVVALQSEPQVSGATGATS